MKLVDGFEVDGKYVTCKTCRVGIDVSGISSDAMTEAMMSSFLMDHTAHTRDGHSCGLTPTGKPSKRAREALARLDV